LTCFEGLDSPWNEGGGQKNLRKGEPGNVRETISVLKGEKRPGGKKNEEEELQIGRLLLPGGRPRECQGGGRTAEGSLKDIGAKTLSIRWRKVMAMNEGSSLVLDRPTPPRVGAFKIGEDGEGPPLVRHGRVGARPSWLGAKKIEESCWTLSFKSQTSPFGRRPT